MGTARPGHFAESKIQTLCENNIQHAKPVFARCPGTQMGEGVNEPCVIGHLREHICDPHFWQATIEVQDQAIGFSGNVSFKAFDAQSPILDDPAWEGAVPDCLGKPVQPVVQPLFSICKPDFRLQWHRQSHSLRGLDRNQSLFQVAVAARMSKPDITGSEGLTQMEQHRDNPETVPVRFGVAEMPSPF